MKTPTTHMLFLLLLATLFWGCVQEMDESVHVGKTDVVRFSVAHSGNDVPQTKGERYYGYLSVEEDTWDLQSQEGADTKVDMVSQLSGSAGVFGYVNNELVTGFDNLQFEFDGDELVSKNQSTSVYWKNISSSDSDNVDFFVYAPREDEFEILKTEKQEPDLETETVKLSYAYSFEYTMPQSSSSQQDIVVAHAGVMGSNRQTVPLEFNHIFTAIRFKVASDISNVESLEISGVNDKGTYTFGKGWSGQTKSNDIITYTCGIGDSDILMMIPQSFASGSGAKVVLHYKESADATETKSITAGLDGQNWAPGRLITYTIHKQAQSGGADSYIYFDLAAGNVTISATEYSGYVYVKGMSGAQIVSGTHNKSNKYYVFQSNKEAYFGGYANEADFNAKQSCMVPNYPGVTYNGQSWADFITNNSNVEQVIEVWDDGKNVNGSSASYDGKVIENHIGTAVVRKAGRTHTSHYINVSGNVKECNLTIDNIYTVAQDQAKYDRKIGGIAFRPELGSSYDSDLILNFKGDNRMGCIHYTNNEEKKNSLVLGGTGTLTVADADFHVSSTSKYQGGTSVGYFSNRRGSAIGSSDTEPDEAYNIEINSGVIFAGTTATEYATAIGGGGNGWSSVTINGGTVTAVATTTGTAIGGGTGVSYPGGQGIVTITNGNVYAYNYRNVLEIPAAAIGGGGSSVKKADAGIVDISGGYVYAYSGYGTAIGGGSSRERQGGDAQITITGGVVIAKSADGTGIGGGMGGNSSALDADGNVMKDENGKSVPAFGGIATVTISGTPIIRTGSIGGGSTVNTKGKIGTAQVEISGGDIQAQFVMAAGAATAPKFTMTGGKIRNGNTLDNSEYKCIKDNGGAVYMEAGTLTMSKGSITHCSAVEGGAIYVNGGDVTIEGDAEISGNLARGGNGGAICINNGNFMMRGNASITGNAAQYYNGGGSGGGVYVSSSNDLSVSLLSGLITGNSADRYGGGISVDMGSASGKKADIVIGTKNGTKLTPKITGNSTQVSGGGLYAEGSGAALTIYSGTIFGNMTSGYTYNPDIANEGGMVTLVGDGDKYGENGEVIEVGQVELNYVEVTYDPNQGKINGSTDPYVQKIVTSTNSLLVPPTDVTKTGYNFVSWNTRSDGLGTDQKVDKAVNLSGDLYLYAKWKIQK